MVATRLETDILIIGAGPAGLQAAIHAARRKHVAVTITGRIEKSGLSRAQSVENYFGLKTKVTGWELLNTGLAQAQKFGATHINEEIIELKFDNTSYTARTDSNTIIHAKSIILAMGISKKELGVPGEKEFYGSGVSYCADCDCRFFSNKIVVVVGDENAAAFAALILAEYAKKVLLVSKQLEVSEHLIHLLNSKSVKILGGRTIVEIRGKRTVKAVVLDDGTIIDAEGVFIERGTRGVRELALNIGIFPNESGYIQTDQNQETCVRGVFACGDICGEPHQVAKAVGEGCIAGVKAAEYVLTLKAHSE
jgi:thioredoxin reductase (NADPH)